MDKETQKKFDEFKKETRPIQDKLLTVIEEEGKGLPPECVFAAIGGLVQGVINMQVNAATKRSVAHGFVEDIFLGLNGGYDGK